MSDVGPKLLELVIENAYHFTGKHSIKLDNMGLINLLGRNFDTTEESSNGSGKSMIIHCLLRVLYGKKVTKEESVAEAMNGKNFCIGIKIQSKGKLYEMYEARKHSDFVKDGLHCFVTDLQGDKERKAFGLKNAGEQLRQDFTKAALGMSFEEFVGSTVITQGSTHVLINGTPQERVAFISKIFGLGVYDDLYNKFKLRLTDVSNELNDYVNVRVELASLKKRRDTLGDVSELPERIEKLKLKLSKKKARRRQLRDGINEAARLRGTYESYKTAMVALKEFESKNSKLNLGNYKEEIQVVSDILAKLNNKVAKAEASRDKLNSLSILKKQYKNIKNSIDEKYASYTLQEIRALIASKEQKEKVATDKLRAQVNQKDLVETVRVNLQQLQQIGMNEGNCEESEVIYKEYEAKEEEHKATVEKCLTLLDVKEGVDTHLANCPTCGSVINAKRIESEIAALKKEMIEAERERKAARRIWQKHKLFCDTTKLVENNDLDMSITETALRELATKIKAMRERIVNLKHIEGKIVDLEKIQAQIGSFGDVSTASDYSELVSKRDRAASSLTKYQEYSAILKSLPEKKPSNVKSNTAELQSELEEVDNYIEELNSKISKLQRTVDEHEEISASLVAITAKVKKVRALERDVRVLKGLCLAYGPKGLKTVKIREVIESIKERLPAWTARMFTQKGFRIDTTGNESKLGFTVVQTRKVNGKKVEKTYDIRRTSGGEKTRVMIALILTLIDIVPEDKRSNLLILDELEGGLDQVNRSLIAEHLIPALKKRKPTLIVVSHSLDTPRKTFDHEIVVTRKNSQATIETIKLRK